MNLIMDCGFNLKLWFKLVLVLPCSVFERIFDYEGFLCLIFCFFDMVPQFDRFVMYNGSTINDPFGEQYSLRIDGLFNLSYLMSFNVIISNSVLVKAVIVKVFWFGSNSASDFGVVFIKVFMR